MTTRRFLVSGELVIDPRQTRAWRRLVEQVIREEPLCWLRLRVCTGVSTTGDHIIPVSEQPELGLVRTNVRGACRKCNNLRRNLPADPRVLDALRHERDRAGGPSPLSIFERR